jgi:HK97 family phage major capsid protein/HK97 family phage prohead protease
VNRDKTRELLGQTVRRAFTIGQIDAEKRTIEIAFSSDAEIERWPGCIEVLSHERGAVDLDRLNDGGPLLFNHDLDRHLGVIETAQIDADGKGRAMVRFGNSPLASEKWQDVQDGILCKASVGYRIRGVKLVEEREDGSDVYLVTQWEPYEISLVTAPVDNSVGVGRSLPQTENKPHNKISKRSIMNREQLIALLNQRGIEIPENATDADLVRMVQESESSRSPKPKINVDEHRAAGRQEEQTRVRSISEAGRKYRKPELAQQAIEQGKTVEEFRAMLLESVDADNKAIVDGSKPVGLSEKEARSFSFVKLLRSLAEPNSVKFREDAKFEFEACAAAADQSHRAARGMMIPVDVLTTPLVKRDIVSIKTAAGYTGTGGNTVQTTLLSSSFIDLLRNRAVLMQLGTELSGLVGDIDIPKQTSGSTSAAWIGEDDDAPNGDVKFGLVQLRAHTLAVYGEITRKMLMQSSLGVEALVRADLARDMALAVDRAGFYGDGTANDPIGILDTAGINTVDFAAVQPTYEELVAMETAIAMDNADVDSMAYIANAAFRGYAKTTLKFAGVPGGTIWEQGNTVNGYNTPITNQITTGDVFFGNYADLLIAMWGGLDVTVDPFTQATKGRIRIVNFQDFDFAARRAASFCFGQKPAAP